MKKLRIIAIIIFIALIVIGAIFYFVKEKALITGKQAETTEKTSAEKITPIEPAIPHLKETSTEVPAISPEPLTAEQEQKKEISAKPAEKEALAGLQADPPTIEIKVPEGKRGKSVFRLTNNLKNNVLLKIYKSEENPETGTLNQESFVNASSYSGAPWLIQFPVNKSLKSGESTEIEVTVEARNLDAGQHLANLIILGKNDGELLVVPVQAEIEKAVKISITKVEVDDGTSSGTTGNSDGVANSGEKAAVTLTLKNSGHEDARDLKVEIRPYADDPITLQNNIIEIPYLGAQSQTQITVSTEVSKEGHETIPPSVTMVISDNDGIISEQTFYVGDPEKIEYPLGAIVDEKQREELQKEEY
ncbi:MAG: hypothetical protein KJ818_07250 [Candidatus Omnitrophica bacterium]|nr:hypothetical protein [Candidatus Omnitrophota bacterium]